MSYLSNNCYDNHARGLITKLQYYLQEKKSIVEHCLNFQEDTNVLPFVRANKFTLNSNLEYLTESLDGIKTLIYVKVMCSQLAFGPISCSIEKACTKSIANNTIVAIDVDVYSKDS